MRFLRPNINNLNFIASLARDVNEVSFGNILTQIL